MESRRLRVDLYWCLAFLLFVSPGAASVPVEGLKGGNITLPCSLSNREDLSTVLIFGSKIAYGRGQNEHFTGRVHESGSCDLILQDLKTTDAGKYTSNVFANGQQLDSRTYYVHVKVSLTGRKGKELMFDLPHEAENVTHFTDPDWTEVWRRGQGALTDRLIDKNGLLSIKNFSSSDAGIYRVLNSSGGGILLTVTVTAFSTDPSAGSKDKHDGKHKDQTHEQVHDGVWIGIGSGVVALAALIVFAVMMKRWCQNRNKKRDSYQEVQMKDTVQGPDHQTTAVDIW